MTIDEAAQYLKEMYCDASRGKVLSVHLFGIRFASELDGMPLKEIVARAGLPESYDIEVRAGINLAKYVREI
jgi:hypothetical protein